MGVFLVPLYLGMVLTPANATESNVSVSFSALTWGGVLKDVYYESIGTGDIAFEAGPRVRTRHYRYTGPRDLVFYRKQMVNGEAQQIPMGTARFPGGSGEYLMVLFPLNGDSGKEKWRGFVLEKDFRSLPEKSFTFVNLSPYRIAGLIGEERIVLAAGDSSTIRFNDREGSRRQVKLAFQKEDKVAIFWSTIYSLIPGLRQIFLIGVDSEGELSVVRLQERVAAGSER